MNSSRYVWGSLVVFIYLFLIEFVFHAFIMDGWYNQALHLLRPEAESNALFHWMALGFVILAFGFCYIFVQGYKGRGIGEGIRYGLYVAITFSVSTNLINHTIFPYPGEWIVGWLIAYPIEMMTAGAIIASIYKPKA